MGGQAGANAGRRQATPSDKPAMVSAASWPIRPHSATSSHTAYAPEERKVGGSTPPMTTSYDQAKRQSRVSIAVRASSVHRPACRPYPCGWCLNHGAGPCASRKMPAAHAGPGISRSELRLQIPRPLPDGATRMTAVGFAHNRPRRVIPNPGRCGVAG